MTKSMLAAVHAAMQPIDDDHSPDGGETGATAPETGKEDQMDKDQGKKPSAEQGETVTKAEHDAAVATARSEGAKQATDRLTAILGAEGIKGDASRMGAAIDLATKSPDMPADDVTAFVTGNVAAASAGKPSEYERNRVEGANLATPAPAAGGRQKAEINTADIYAKRRSA